MVKEEDCRPTKEVVIRDNVGGAPLTAVSTTEMSGEEEYRSEWGGCC